MPTGKEPECVKCKGVCCRHIALQVEKPVCKRDCDNIRWFLMHEKVKVFEDHGGDWLLEFESRCKNLTRGYRCADYENRPNVCRDYPEKDDECEYHGEGHTWRVLFTNVQQFERYLARKGIDWKYSYMKPGRKKGSGKKR